MDALRVRAGDASRRGRGSSTLPGMVPGRPHDSFGGTFIYAHVSDRARALDRDTVFFTGSRGRCAITR